MRVDRFAAAAALVAAMEQVDEAEAMVAALGPSDGSYTVDWGEPVPREFRRWFRGKVQELRPAVACVWGCRGQHLALVGPLAQVEELRELREAAAIIHGGLMGRGGDA